MGKKKSLIEERLTVNQINNARNNERVAERPVNTPSAPVREREFVRFEESKPKKERKERQVPKFQKKNEAEDSFDKLFEYEDSSKLTELDIENDAVYRQNEDIKNTRKYNVWTRLTNIILISACIYLIFLIYGVAVTEYHYDAEGKVVAQRMSVQDIREKKEYEIILAQYMNCRILYEEVLTLDYRLGAGVEDPLVIAPEYEALLDEVSNLSIKTEALSVPTKYSQMKEMMLSWIKNDIAVYLQNMSSAISQNNTETANNALQDKDRVYENFSILTQNVVATGSTLAGIDLTDIKYWTPENYIDSKINGN